MTHPTELAKPTPFQGLRTVKYAVNDLDKAKAWYTPMLEIEPYFDEPFYVGYNVGGYELALDPDAEASKAGESGVVAYWGVQNADKALQRALDLGALLHEAVQDVGGGIKVASVLDPFGNIFGMIENPHFQLPTDVVSRV